MNPEQITVQAFTLTQTVPCGAETHCPHCPSSFHPFLPTLATSLNLVIYHFTFTAFQKAPMSFAFFYSPKTAEHIPNNRSSLLKHLFYPVFSLLKIIQELPTD